MCVSIFFWSSTIPGLLHSARRWIKVEEQGPPDQLWEEAAPTTEAPAATTAVYIDELGRRQCGLCLQRTESGGRYCPRSEHGFQGFFAKQ